MNTTALLDEIRRLPPEDRLELTNRLWDELSRSPDVAPLTDKQRKLLDERSEAHRRDPSAALPWKQVRDEVLGDL